MYSKLRGSLKAQRSYLSYFYRYCHYIYRSLFIILTVIAIIQTCNVVKCCQLPPRLNDKLLWILDGIGLISMSRMRKLLKQLTNCARNGKRIFDDAVITMMHPFVARPVQPSRRTTSLNARLPNSTGTKSPSVQQTS